MNDIDGVLYCEVCGYFDGAHGCVDGICRAPAVPAKPERLYYILDARTSVGNCASWWAPNGQGYVCDLGAAGKYTEAEAFSKRDTDVPVPCEVAEANVIQHVRIDVQTMRPYWDKKRGKANSQRMHMKDGG